MNERLSELKTWLLSCSYLLTITEKAFFNAKLQGPAPKKYYLENVGYSPRSPKLNLAVLLVYFLDCNNNHPVSLQMSGLRFF